MSTKRERQMEQIRHHGENLLALFPEAKERDPVALCKKLRRLEAKGEALALRLCNGPAFDSDEEWESISDGIKSKVLDLLGQPDVPIKVNLDPRGYALKISDEWIRLMCETWDRLIAKKGKKAIGPQYWGLLRLHKDWGGYGILATEFSGN